MNRDGLTPGEVVVDPEHGLCTVKRTRVRDGRRYLVLDVRATDSLTLLVPTDSPRKLSPPPGRKQAEQALAVLDTPPDEDLLASHYRHRRSVNRQRLTAGLSEVAKVIRDQRAYLARRPRSSHGVPVTDLRHLRLAEQRLAAGLSEAGLSELA